jgi:hypothetical protein
MMRIVIALVAVLSFTLPSFAEQKKPAKPKPSLRGSARVARKQNTEADRERLTRIADEKQLRRFVESGLLVPVPQNLFVRIDSGLKPEYRYVRPWTREFLNDLGRAHYLRFRRPIQVNSAVRPTSRQKILRKTNGNAAPTSGPYRSSHATASTVDIAKGENLEWMRDYLQQKKATGNLAVAEEFQQSVFHVMVFQGYGKKIAKPATTKRKAAVAKAKPRIKSTPRRPLRKKR